MVFVQGTVDVGEYGLGDGFARGEIVIAVGKNFRFDDRNQTRLLADGSVSGEVGKESVTKSRTNNGRKTKKKNKYEKSNLARTFAFSIIDS